MGPRTTTESIPPEHPLLCSLSSSSNGTFLLRRNARLVPLTLGCSNSSLRSAPPYLPRLLSPLARPTSCGESGLVSMTSDQRHAQLGTHMIRIHVAHLLLVSGALGGRRETPGGGATVFRAAGTLLPK